MNSAKKVAIITGSSSLEGVGGESAVALAERGFNVVINYRNSASGAEDVAAACATHGADALVVRGDVAEEQDCDAIVAAALDRWGRIDALVNNAAITRPVALRDLEKVTKDDFLDIYGVNVVGAFMMSRCAAPAMKRGGDGAIVNVSSVSGIHGLGSSIAYAASKAAINTLTLTLATALAPEIRVNAVVPGGLLGGWTRSILTEEGYQQRIQDAQTLYPLRTAVWPKDVAETIAWLITGARTSTGELIRMDSGRHLPSTG
jgi:3-oxoacyl-[acyl-carrier protein] reductase